MDDEPPFERMKDIRRAPEMIRRHIGDGMQRTVSM
jgi:hypothetical protein